MGNSADELTVLDDRRARHECGQEGTTHFYNFLPVLISFVTLLFRLIFLYFAEVRLHIRRLTLQIRYTYRLRQLEK